MQYTDPIYGEVELSDAEEDVIKNAGMQRLKEVHQNGADYLVNPDMDTSRFEHSLGTAVLCKRYEADEDEVIAALVHDISHTAFSHVIDQVFEVRDQDFHEDYHERFITQYGLDEIIQDHGYDPNYVFDEDNFSILERSRPDLCADRLDYMMRDTFKYGLVDKSRIQDILDGTTVENGVIKAKDVEIGENIMDLFYSLNRDVFFDQRHEAANLLMKNAIDEALNDGVLEEEDVFDTDEHLIQKMRDSKLEDQLSWIENGFNVKSGGEFVVNRKHRIVDPQVVGTDQRVSDISESSKDKFHQFKNKVPEVSHYDIEVL